MKKLSAIFILSSSLASAFVYGQADSLSKQSPVSKLQRYLTSHTPEKDYLQFDKPYYAAGDTIYFKAYVTKGGRHVLSDISGVLHVDLINTHDQISQSIKLQIDSGITWGDFALPDSLPGGNYRIRAYTQWMRNNGNTGFFEQVIPIGSLKAAKVPESLEKQPDRQPNAKPDLQFFPEGGKLVAGLRSKIAFKAVAANGLGMGVKGELLDNKGKKVMTFASAHLGMGFFYFTPEEGKSYSAKVSYPDGLTDLVALPKPEISGILLTVNNDSIPNAAVSIAANKSYFEANRNRNFTLLIYDGGKATTLNCKLDSTVITLDILKRKLQTGIATVTLFSPEGQPLCERSLFIQNYDRLNLNVSNKPVYSQREKVTLNLKVKNRADSAVTGHFSVSVIDESKVPADENNESTILTNLLLTSDLKGYVEQPNYYFTDTSAAARKNLDLVMLTHGYRQFNWEQVLDTTKQALAYLPEKGIEISGQVKSLFNKPITNGTITLIPAKGGHIFSSMTDAKGFFKFTGFDFTDTVHFVLSAVNAKNRNSTKITYFDDRSTAPSVEKSFETALPPTGAAKMAGYLTNDILQQRETLNSGKVKGIMLKQVDIHSKKPDDKYETLSLAGAGNADQVMHADELERIGGPLTMSLDGRLHGVTFVAQGFGKKVPYLTLSLINASITAPKPMLVIIDGAETDPGDMNFLTSSDVETIELMKYTSTSIYGVSGGDGVLVITTKKTRSPDPKNIAATGVLPVNVMGYYKAREFYSPKYDSPVINNHQKDLRSTIYWLPEIKTDIRGNASFDYYNADGAGSYKIVVEGIDDKGNLGTQVYKYSVQ